MTSNKMIPEQLVAIMIQKIKEAKTIAISGHMNPDGDCVGACLALCTYILDQYPEKQVDVYLEPINKRFRFLKYADSIMQEKKLKEPYELFFALDCSDPERLNGFKDWFEEADYKICIDHHITNLGFGDFRLIDGEASSTCEILYRYFDYDKISFDCAQALYLGLIHDTGVFKHSNTTHQVMDAAGALIDKGVRPEFMIDETFYKKTYAQNQILGRALTESILLLGGQMIFSVITKKDMEFCGVDSGDLDGIIDQLRVTEGVECALLLYEKEEDTYKVSMRSNGKVDVSQIAMGFGGGGHVKAAGCTMKGIAKDIVNNIAQRVEIQLEEIQSEEKRQIGIHKETSEIQKTLSEKKQPE